MSTPSPISITHRPSAIFTVEVQSPTDVGRSRLSSGAQHDEENRIRAEKAARYPDGNLEYSIPKVVESLREGRRDSCNAAAIVAALLATIEATMIALIKTPALAPGAGGSAPSLLVGSGGANAIRLLLILSYAGLILNTSTTFSALLLIDRLGNLSFISKDVEPTITQTSLRSGRRLLGRYGASGKVWDILEFHYFSTLLAGFLTITAQIVTFIWIYEGLAVAITSTLTASFCLIPFVMIFVW